MATYEPHACIVVYSITDRVSFKKAEDILELLWRENFTQDKSAILVGNKVDLARSRKVQIAGKANEIYKIFIRFPMDFLFLKVVGIFQLSLNVEKIL